MPMGAFPIMTTLLPAQSYPICPYPSPACPTHVDGALRTIELGCPLTLHNTPRPAQTALKSVSVMERSLFEEYRCAPPASSITAAILVLAQSRRMLAEISAAAPPVTAAVRSPPPSSYLRRELRARHMW